MNKTYKAISILVIIFIVILLSLVFYFKYKKTPQPTKEEAYRRGLGYYTKEESLGCVNSSLKCNEPGEETFVQYCIPNPTTGRGCINLDGLETYNMSIRKKPCNVNCQSHKFVVEDKIQVKNPGVLTSTETEVLGSGCNKIIDDKLGLDYTDFFLKEYNTDPENPNTYPLKSCIPSEGFTGYYQKTFTCQKNDSKGDNNCVFTCGSEGNILGINGLFGSKLSKNLLKYYPVELDFTGNKRYVCPDINDVDQIDILNYTNEVPSDFIYPNLCYKHSTVLNYNGELWPNENSQNVFNLRDSYYQPKFDYYTINGTSLQPLLGEGGIINSNYDLSKDFNSYTKIFLGNEITILNQIVGISGDTYSLSLYDYNTIPNVPPDNIDRYNNEQKEIINKNNYSLVFYMSTTTSITGNKTFYTDSSAIKPLTGFKYNNSNFSNYYEFLNIRFNKFTNGQINFNGTGNPFIEFLILPTNCIFSNVSNTITLSFDWFTFESYKLIMGKYAYLEITSNGKNYGFFCEFSDILSKKTLQTFGFYTYYRYTYTITVPSQYTSVIDNKTQLTSPIFSINNNVTINNIFVMSLYHHVVENGVEKIEEINFNLVDSFKTGNIKMNSFIQPKTFQDSNTGNSVLKYTNETLLTNYLDGNYYSLKSGNTFSVKSNSGSTKTLTNGKLDFVFVSNGVYSTSFLTSNYTFKISTVKESDGTIMKWNVLDSNNNNVGSATVSSEGSDIDLNFINGEKYTLTPSQKLIFTTVYYLYGNNNSPVLEGDTNNYYWYPLMLNSDLKQENIVTFTDYTEYNFTSVNINFNGFFRPSDETGEITYLDFNQESGFANNFFEYVEFPSNSGNYYIRNLSRSSTTGNYKLKEDLYLFNDNDLSTNIGNNFQIFRDTDTSYSQELFNLVTLPNNIQLIRRNSKYFDYIFFQTKEAELTYSEKKIREYMTMISEQNNGFDVDNKSQSIFQLIITPQKTVILNADYRVFKSPYTINQEDGSYNFLCYNEKGVPLAKGTRVNLGENEKMYINKGCNDYNTSEESMCGVIGIESAGSGTSVTPCQQVRVTQNANFTQNCLPYTENKYNTIENLFESGVNLRETVKGKIMGEEKNSNTLVFEDFFTREEDSTKVYKPNQELYINKNKQNFYLSLKDNNTEFVVEPSSWERVFVYQNLTLSTVFQNHLSTQNKILSTISNYPQFSTSPEDIKSVEIVENFPYRMVYKNTKSGLNTQNFFYSGFQFYYDTNSGANWNYYKQEYATLPRANQSITTEKGSTSYVSYYNGNPITPSGGYQGTGLAPIDVNILISNENIWDPNTMFNRFIPATINQWYYFVNFGKDIYDTIPATGIIEQVRLGNIGESLDDVKGRFPPEPSPYGDTAKGYNPSKGFVTAYDNPPDNNIYNANNFKAFAQIVKVTVDNKIKNLIKVVITDNNLTNQYSDVKINDYINLDSEFFNQILINLNNFKNPNNKDIKLSQYTNNPSTQYKTLQISSTVQVNSSRNLVIGSEDAQNIFRGGIEIGKEFSTIVFTQNSFNFQKEFETFVESNNIELFDILVFLGFPNYFIRVLDIIQEKNTEGKITKYTIIVKNNLTNVDSNPASRISGVYNLKKSTTLLSNYNKIIDVSGNQVSFYFNIDDYQITSFEQIKGNGAIIYDTGSVNTETSMFINNISLRYIKDKVQIPFYRISDSLVGSMTVKNNNEYFDTKLLSYVTQYYYNDADDFYYFKEFREETSYNVPTVTKTFAINDVIKYITKSGTANSYSEEDVALFKIIDIDVSLSLKYNNTSYSTRYDYKCKLVQGINLENPSVLSKNEVNFYPSSELDTTGKIITQKTYCNVNDFNGYQLPYCVSLESETNKDPYYYSLVLGETQTGDVGYLDILNINSPQLKNTTERENVNHDYQRLNFNSNVFLRPNKEPNKEWRKNPIFQTAKSIQDNLNYSTKIRYPSNHIRGNRLDVLSLYSTVLRSSVNSSTDYINIEIEKLTGKPYGSEFLLNITNPIPNYNRFGNILEFKITVSNLDSSKLGDIFESNKGFQLILTNTTPSEYQFVSIENTSKIEPYEIVTGQTTSSYTQGDLVSLVDRNVRQYFRNNTEKDSSFNFQLQKTSNFELVPKTVYPQNGFIDYHPDIYYQKGEIVRLDDPKELSGLYIVEKSNLGVSISSTESEFWTYDILGKEMKSNNQQFYSFVYPEETITTGKDLNKIIKDTKSLNNLNLPLIIKTYDSNQEEKSFCPTFCGVKQSDDKTIKQVIDESYVGQLSYFDNIRYLFETPVLIKQESNKSYLTLGNVPVTHNQANDYNVTFLSSSNNSENLMSQFLYFLDLDNDKKIYNKPECNQQFTYYDKQNPSGVSTGVSNFEFSNSLLFQFIPCDLDSQDYLSYQVSDNNLITLNDSNNIFQWNKFPPLQGGSSVGLINKSNNTFTGVSGTFETSYIVNNIQTSEKEITLSNGTSTVTMNINKIGNTLEGIGVSQNITNHGTCYIYGDIWYLTKKGETSIMTYGFVVPDSNGSLTDKSFIQVKDFFSPPEDAVINISSNTGSGFCMSGVSGYQYISDYTLVNVTGTQSGVYSGTFGGKTVNVNIKFNGTSIVQPNQAVFTSSDTVNSGTSLYFPSYNVRENIKVKALASFGSNYLGNIKYNNRGFKSLENKVIPDAIFNNYTNSVFSNELAADSTIVFANNKNLNMNNLLDVVKINFNETTFSMKLNNFSRPIQELNSNLMQKNNINLGAIDSNSINVLISKEIKNVVGVSVKLSLAEIENYNLKYDPTNNIIPGDTNTQIQYKEIRQNRTTDYIDPKNNCSIYFEPELEPTKNLDGDSVFIANNNKSNVGDNINFTLTNQNPYNIVGPQVIRFLPKFESQIIYQPKNSISYYLGNNLIYYFIQTDSSNDNYPMIFSTSGGNQFLTNKIDGLEQNIGNGKIKLSYFLDFKEVDPTVYRHTTTFNSAKNERKIIIDFESEFNITNINTEIYYGINQNNGDKNGGLFKFIYH